MLYLLVLVISLISSYIGMVLILQGYEVNRVRAGSDHRQGYSPIPVVPMVQITYLFVFWFLNQLHDGLGLWVILTYAVVVNSFRIRDIIKLERELERLQKENKDDGANAEQ